MSRRLVAVFLFLCGMVAGCSTSSGIQGSEVATSTIPGPSPTSKPRPSVDLTSTPAETPSATAEPTTTAAAAPTPEPLPASATVADGSGDLRDVDTGAATSGPSYVDVTEMLLEVSGGDLLLRFNLAGDPPSDLDALYTTVGYYFLIDTDADGVWDYEVDLASTDDWSATLFVVGEAFSYSGPNFPGSSFTDGPLVLIRIGLDKIGAPSELRIQGVVQYEDFPDPVNDPFTSNTAEDLIPDGDAQWIALGTGL